jgi:cytochrome c peroxidase
MRFTSSSAVAAALLVAGCGSDPGPGDAAAASSAGLAGSRSKPSSVVTVENASGVAQTINVSGGPVVDPTNPFFQSLGTNGRSCSTCHDAKDSMTLTPARLRERFDETNGKDPVFQPVDGTDSPLADRSTVRARRAASSMLLGKGLIRIGMRIPATAEFELVDVQDPHGFASAAELSLFRRPLPATNLVFLSTVMWDGRETFKDATQSTGFAPLDFDLADQSNAATLGHAQGAAPLTDGQRQAIVDFETQLFTAQVEDEWAGDLTKGGATGGPRALSTRPFLFGMNDPLDGGPFDPVAMTDFAAWSGSSRAARASVARGEDLFNTLPIPIAGVSGLNDDLGVATIQGSCTTCHDTPHAGDHSVPAPLRIGTDAPAPLGGLDATGLPVYTLRNKTTGELELTTDPGRALVTGKWKDVGRFKGPILRGLAGRAPYFHNGAAPDLETVVRFYDQRFGLGLTDQQKADLVAFLRTL